MKKRTAKSILFLTALALPCTLLSGTSFPLTTPAHAQPRMGTPEWEKNRATRRASDYHDSDLARLNWATVRGRITNNPDNDFFEFRDENGESFRVLVRADVSLRGIERNDFVQVYGKRDGDILVAYRVTKLNEDWQDGQTRRIRGIATSAIRDRRFGLRLNNERVVNIISATNSVRGISQGDEVEVEGRWDRKGQVFRISKAWVIRKNNEGNFQHGSRVNFKGQVTKATALNKNWFFTVRSQSGRHVTVRYTRQFRVGDRVTVQGVVEKNVVVASHMRKQ